MFVFPVVITGQEKEAMHTPMCAHLTRLKSHQPQPVSNQKNSGGGGGGGGGGCRGNKGMGLPTFSLKKTEPKQNLIGNQTANLHLVILWFSYVLIMMFPNREVDPRPVTHKYKLPEAYSQLEEHPKPYPLAVLGGISSQS